MTTRSGTTKAAGSHEPHGGRGDGEERDRRGEGTVRRLTVHHDGVTIPVTRGGRGRPLVLCPGLHTTQADLRELTGLLRRDHDVVTFDLRGHGLASAADRYSFEAFLGDLGAVLAELERLDLPEAPLLVGYSLGADLAVHHASEHPGGVAGLVLVDGAVPVPEPFVTEADLPLFRAMWQEQAARHEAERGTARQVLLTAREVLDLNVEIDAVRSTILDRYDTIDLPVSMVASTAMAGDGGGGHASRFNRNWRAGVARLAREQPRIAVHRLDADHQLVFTHAPEIARVIRDTRGPAERIEPSRTPRPGGSVPC
ncbi:alpha/beta hydrolase [Nocardiopsis dassonvillei]|uniref:alpha/beta fold hydrolase n=1 Tax=Nocardiopsis dassonvillei TaxID=2014 RepID=UPI00102C48E1|nr:alpha/beta hydrolase [Nocardiopsis dassonvillei]MCP3012394.1 alpha/beta hydrolase [Nocardiopsis dassonvillei]